MRDAARGAHCLLRLSFAGQSSGGTLLATDQMHSLRWFARGMRGWISPDAPVSHNLCKVRNSELRNRQASCRPPERQDRGPESKATQNKALCRLQCSPRPPSAKWPRCPPIASRLSDAQADAETQNGDLRSPFTFSFRVIRSSTLLRVHNNALEKTGWRRSRCCRALMTGSRLISVSRAPAARLMPLLDDENVLFSHSDPPQTRL